MKKIFQNPFLILSKGFNLLILTVLSAGYFYNKADAQIDTVLMQTDTFFRNTPGAFSFTVPTYSGQLLNMGETLLLDIDIIIVGAGGGGGRGNGAGGGGGGEVRRITITANEGDVLNGVIGSGGLGATVVGGSGGNGSSTSFNGITIGGGLGGGGGNSGLGGASGSGFGGGIGINDGTRRAGGGGAGASQNGNNGGTTTTPPRATAGSGGNGLNGFGGGGGGAAQGGTGGAGNNVVGIGRDGGTNGSTATAIAATNGGGGGGGRTGGGKGGDGLVQITVSFSILPVEYLYFDANFKRQDRLVELKWATAKEWENSHFEVERSINDVNSWEKIGKIEGHGFSDGAVKYKFEDKTPPLVGGNTFYRLKQVDFNGTFEYSKVKSVRLPSTEFTQGIWRAYPNPTDNGQIRVSLLDRTQYNGESITFKIIHPTAISKAVSVTSENEMNEAIAGMVGGIPKGVFVVEIRWGQKVEHIKVLKK